jgi:phospholipase A-2-activating protein
LTFLSKVRAVVALSNDLVVSAARDKTVRSWNRTQANDFQQQYNYMGHSHYVNALASLPPSPEHPKGKLRCVLAFHKQSVEYQLISIGLIVSSGSDKTINVYDVEQPGDPVYTLVGHTENVCSLSVTPSGDIISGSWDK